MKKHFAILILCITTLFASGQKWSQLPVRHKAADTDKLAALSGDSTSNVMITVGAVVNLADTDLSAIFWSEFGNSGTTPTLNGLGTTDTATLKLISNDIAIGYLSEATSLMVIGESNTFPWSSGTPLIFGNGNTGKSSALIFGNSNNGTGGMMFGNANNAKASDILLGSSNTSSGTGSNFCVGSGNSISGHGCTIIGSGITCSFNNCTMFGDGSISATANNQIWLGGLSKTQCYMPGALAFESGGSWVFGSSGMVAMSQGSSSNTIWSFIGISSLSATGTPSSSTFLRGDNTWSTPTNATITLSGAVTGSGTTAITTTYAGTLGNTIGGTGINTSSSTGVAQVTSGTWSVSTALANGTTATTQASTDNTTKVATDAFVKTATTPTVQYDSNSTNGTVVSNGLKYLCEHGSSTTLTFTPPTSPSPGQEWIITTNQTTITVSFSSGTTFVAAPTTITKLAPARFIYLQTGSGSYSWYNNN